MGGHSYYDYKSNAEKARIASAVDSFVRTNIDKIDLNSKPTVKKVYRSSTIPVKLAYSTESKDFLECPEFKIGVSGIFMQSLRPARIEHAYFIVEFLIDKINQVKLEIENDKLLHLIH